MFDHDNDDQLDREIACQMFSNGASLAVWKDGTATMYTRQEGCMDGRLTADCMFVERLLGQSRRYWPDGTPAG